MNTANVQFHMLLDEVLGFVDTVRAQYSLQIELERWHPKGVRVLRADADLAAEVRCFGSIDRIWLLFQPQRSKRTERFMLNVGRMRGHRLEQSQFGGGTRIAEAAAVLKKLVSELKRRTEARVWVITENGTTGLSKTFRVSPGAGCASREGQVELTGIGFTQTMRVDPPRAG